MESRQKETVLSPSSISAKISEVSSYKNFGISYIH